MAPIPALFQQFDLDLETLAKQEADAKKTGKELNLFHARKELFADLKQLGYVVLEANAEQGTLPLHILVSGDVVDQDIKGDFGSAAQRYNLPYKSGPCYFTHLPDR